MRSRAEVGCVSSFKVQLHHSHNSVESLLSFSSLAIERETLWALCWNGASVCACLVRCYLLSW